MNQENYLSLLSILYVEDEEDTRAELSRFLKRRISRLDTASNGAEALLAFQSNPPDILITDLRMPDMDGLELTRRIRELGYSTPIIVTSALSDSETILSAVDRGIVKFIVKPIDAHKLEETLYTIGEQIMAKRSKLTQNSVLLSSEDREKTERNIARDLSALLKSKTGKGPKKLRVQLTVESIQVQISGMLTALEKTLMSGTASPESLAMNREHLYRTLHTDIQKIIRTYCDCNIHLFKYEGQLRDDKEQIFYKAM